MAGIGLQRKQLDARLGRRARPEETSVEDQVKLQGAGAGLQIAGNLALQIYENQGKASMLDAEGKVKLAGIQYRQDFLKKLQKTEDVNEIVKTINDFQSGIEQNWSKSVGDAEKSVVPGYRGAFRSQMKRKGQLNGVSMQSFSEGAGNTEIKGVLQEKFNLAMQGGDLEYASALVVGGAAYFGSSAASMIGQIDKAQKTLQLNAFENELQQQYALGGEKQLNSFMATVGIEDEYGLTAKEAAAVASTFKEMTKDAKSQHKQAQEVNTEDFHKKIINGKANEAELRQAMNDGQIDSTQYKALRKALYNPVDDSDPRALAAVNRAVLNIDGSRESYTRAHKVYDENAHKLTRADQSTMLQNIDEDYNADQKQAYKDAYTSASTNILDREETELERMTALVLEARAEGKDVKQLLLDKESAQERVELLTDQLNRWSAAMDAFKTKNTDASRKEILLHGKELWLTKYNLDEEDLKKERVYDIRGFRKLNAAESAVKRQDALKAAQALGTDVTVMGIPVNDLSITKQVTVGGERYKVPKGTDPAEFKRRLEAAQAVPLGTEKK